MKTALLNAGKEPLVQFLFLGCLIFIFDQMVSVDRADPKTIFVNDKLLGELRTIFQEGQGRLPSKQEENNMLIKWTQNEILYREGLSLQLDQGDEMIRNRLILKMRNIILNKITPQEPTDKELAAWYEIYGHNYAKPETFTLEQFALEGDETEATIQQLLLQLNNNGTIPEQYQNILRRYQNRSAENLKQMFSPQSITDLIKQKQSLMVATNWQLIESKSGKHLARITTHKPAQQPELQAIKSRVSKDWQQYAKDMQLAKQTTNIAKKYTIHFELDESTNSQNQQTIDADKLIK